MPARSHGHKAGGNRSRAYVTWVNMKSRCRNPARPDFANYGGRGIGFDQSWGQFEIFLADMGDPPAGMTLERNDNNLSYSKDNCRWASRAEQSLNKRNCVRYEFAGQSKTLAEWSRETGIGRVTLLKRLQRGVPVDIALSARGYLCASRGSHMHQLA